MRFPETSLPLKCEAEDGGGDNLDGEENIRTMPRQKASSSTSLFVKEPKSAFSAVTSSALAKRQRSVLCSLSEVASSFCELKQPYPFSAPLVVSTDVSP